MAKACTAENGCRAMEMLVKIVSRKMNGTLKRMTKREWEEAEEAIRYPHGPPNHCRYCPEEVQKGRTLCDNPACRERYRKESAATWRQTHMGVVRKNPKNMRREV